MTLHIDVWSDIACPWCWIGKRRLERALEMFEHAADVALRWRAFELDPAAPALRDPKVSYAERLAKKYGTTIPQAEAMIDRVTSLGEKEGLEFRFDRVRSGNTFDAHRLLHLAGERGVQDAMKERLLSAYFSEGRAIGDRSELAALAAELGIAEDEASRMLESDEHADEVRREETEAQMLGIHGVPFFVMGGRLAVSGAQSPEVLAEALTQAHGTADAAEGEAAAGEACGPAGCE